MEALECVLLCAGCPLFPALPLPPGLPHAVWQGPISACGLVSSCEETEAWGGLERESKVSYLPPRTQGPSTAPC